MQDVAAELDGAAIFVTGASGFLAASLLIFLDELRNQHGVDIHLAASARRPPEEVPLFRFLDAPFPDEWHMASVEETNIPHGRSWIVIHTASFGAPADYMREPIATFEANTAGLCSLFRQVDSGTCERIVYFSTAEVYGQPPDECIPTPENFRGAPDLLDARSIYGESKRMAEVLGVTLSKEKKIPFSVIRPWNVYGPGQRKLDGRVPVEFFRQLAETRQITLLSDGSPRRSFCHVWEAIPQVVSCLRSQAAVGQAFNVGRQGDEVSILDLARSCAAVADLPVDSVAYDKSNKAPGMKRCQPDTERVRHLMTQDLPGVPLETGLRTCHEWIDFLHQNL